MRGSAHRRRRVGCRDRTHSGPVTLAYSERAEAEDVLDDDEPHVFRDTVGPVESLLVEAEPRSISRLDTAADRSTQPLLLGRLDCQ